MTARAKPPSQPVPVPDGNLGYFQYRMFNILDSIVDGARGGWGDTFRAVVLILTCAGSALAFVALLRYGAGPLVALLGRHVEEGLLIVAGAALFGLIAAAARAIRIWRRWRADREGASTAGEFSPFTDRNTKTTGKAATRYNAPPEPRGPVENPVSAQPEDNAQSQRGQ
jgi:small basic protein